MYDAAPPPSHYEHVVAVHKPRGENSFKRRALSRTKQLDGWCSEYKASTLMELVWLMQPKVVVEIGVFGGKSLVPMAFALQQLQGGVAYGIDPWSAAASEEGMDGANKDWWGNLDHAAILSKLQMKISEFQLGGYIQLIQSTSLDAQPISDIDILHIDGNHSNEASYFDVLKWAPLVRRGGIIIFDDLTWGTTERATGWLDENCVRVITVQDAENEWGVWVKR